LALTPLALALEFVALTPSLLIGRAPALPNFRVPFNLYVHPLTQNYHI